MNRQLLPLILVAVGTLLSGPACDQAYAVSIANASDRSLRVVHRLEAVRVYYDGVVPAGSARTWNYLSYHYWTESARALRGRVEVFDEENRLVSCWNHTMGELIRWGWKIEVRPDGKECDSPAPWLTPSPLVPFPRGG